MRTPEIRPLQNRHHIAAASKTEICFQCDRCTNADEFGSLEGIVTPTDILEAIAGEFTEDSEDKLSVERNEDGSLTIDGWADIRHVSRLLETDLVDDGDRYSTLAGLILWKLGHLPSQGETIHYGRHIFEVASLDGRNIDKVRIRQNLIPASGEEITQ